MISVRRRGSYELIETKRQVKVLYLGTNIYAWIEPIEIGEILVFSHYKHPADCVLSVGNYVLYGVEDEPALSDQLHLELEVGKNTWQGYLLPTGLPDARKKRSRIIPTKETITNNPEFAGRARTPTDAARARRRI